VQFQENAYEAMVARRKVQLEDTIPEYTARGTNLKIELSGITTRGPPLHSPRGAVVCMISLLYFLVVIQTLNCRLSPKLSLEVGMLL
jgi:hypothetical protein